MTLAPDDPRHGTNNGYINFGCRCDACTAARADYSREYKDRLAARPRTDVPHGTASGYHWWRCRCADCRKAVGANPDGRRQAECGTASGYRRHRNAGEPACDDCKRAERESRTAYRRAKGIGPAPVPVCGMQSGYAKHRRDGTTPCQPCKDAEAAYRREYRRRPVAP